MKNIFVNLKRFDVPRSRGGVCSGDRPGDWIRGVISDSVKLRLGSLPDVDVVYLLPESLLVPAQEELEKYPEEARKNLRVGCQSVFRDNIAPGKNFGAFTSNLPAASAYQIGCRWTMIGHSEERRDKREMMEAYQPDISTNPLNRQRAAQAVDYLLNRQVLAALEQGMDVLLCMGETAEERGDGSFEQQQYNIKEALTGQLERGLRNVGPYLGDRKIVIGYEPIWAIGPGKTPPGKEYIAFVSGLIKETVQKLYGFTPAVVYGGGLKEENAAMISSIGTIDGGLVALTRFSGEIGFWVDDLRKIIEKYTLK